MEIRRGDEGSVALWAAMRRELWPDSDAGEIAADSVALLGRPDVAAFLAFEGEAAIGFAEVRLRRDPVNGCDTSPVAFLEGITVREPWRRRGVARALFGAVKAWAVGQGVTEIGSDALLENTDSHRMHAALGFEEMERVVYFRYVRSQQQPSCLSAD